jgi:hypothetical protein
MRGTARRQMVLAAVLSLDAIACGLSVAGVGPGSDDAAPGEMASDDASADVSSSGGFSFDATLPSSGSSGGSTGDGGHAITDSSHDGRDAPSKDAADGTGPCQKLYPCCMAVSDASFPGFNSQGCLQAALDGGATGCQAYLAFFNMFAFCP